MYSITDSLSKLETLAKAEEPIANFLNKILFVFLSKTSPIFACPSQADMGALGECNRAFTDTIIAFIKLFCVRVILLQDETIKDKNNLKKLKKAQSKYPLSDEDVQFIIDNNLLAKSNEEIHAVLEETFLIAYLERKDLSYCSGMIGNIINYYSRVMDEIDLFLPQKKMINAFLLFWMKQVCGIDLH